MTSILNHASQAHAHLTQALNPVNLDQQPQDTSLTNTDIMRSDSPDYIATNSNETFTDDAQHDPSHPFVYMMNPSSFEGLPPLAWRRLPDIISGGNVLYPNNNGHPSANDVSQHLTLDCRFLASLASVAARDPQFIENHIHDNGNGEYTVSLYSSFTGKWVDVVVDDWFPMWHQFDQPDDGRLHPECVQGAGWVMLYEKALCKFYSEYPQSPSGQGNHHGYLALSGEYVENTAPSPFTTILGPQESRTGYVAYSGSVLDHGHIRLDQYNQGVTNDRLVRELRTAFSTPGYVVTATALPSTQAPSLQGMSMAGTSSTSHEYSVLDYRDITLKNGTQMPVMLVRNPNGANDQTVSQERVWNNRLLDEVDDADREELLSQQSPGELWIPPAVFEYFFRNVTIGRIPPSTP